MPRNNKTVSFLTSSYRKLQANLADLWESRHRGQNDPKSTEDFPPSHQSKTLNKAMLPPDVVAKRISHVSVKDSKFHAFIGHNWGKDENNHKRVLALHRSIKTQGVRAWVDQERIHGNILDEITAGLEDSRMFVACITKDYMDKVAGKNKQAPNDWCQLEFQRAFRLFGAANMIAVVMDNEVLDSSKWRGSVATVFANSIVIDFTSDARLDDATKELCARIAGLLSPANA